MKKLKLRNFKKVFQIAKLIEFKIHLKWRKVKFYKLWNLSDLGNKLLNK